MADTAAKKILSVCATTGSRLSDLVIKDGQLIFVQDKQRIALDFKGKRTFYNQIIEVETEDERSGMVPTNGLFYFVIDTAVLWTYRDEWIPLTTPPEDVIFIGVELPELGSANTLYVSKTGGISIWDTDSMSYVVVANKSDAILDEEIDALFV